jgi:hypothetical protein
MKRAALVCLLLGIPLASAASAQDVIFRDGFELVCPADMGDCDGNPADCETSLRTLTDCGECGVPCAREHGTCASGTCETCPAGSGECDGNGATSCETALDTLTDCGGCDVACNLPNASEACNAGLCELGTCDTGFGNCDGNVSNGCEVQHSGHSNSAPGENLGTYDADSHSGFFCTTTYACNYELARTGRRGRHFTITARDGSNCTGDISLRLELLVPSGVNYDLFVTPQRSDVLCQPSNCSATGSGAAETIVVYTDDDAGVDESFTVGIEVRYSNGTSCQDWRLNVYRRGCRN